MWGHLISSALRDYVSSRAGRAWKLFKSSQEKELTVVKFLDSNPANRVLSDDSNYGDLHRGSSEKLLEYQLDYQCEQHTHQFQEIFLNDRVFTQWKYLS